jgi:two-component system, chemotaxis family, sensor kinase CheA
MSDDLKPIDEESTEQIVSKLREAFKDEAHELLAELEAALLELEEVPGDEELIGRVFRVMHTIKGSGGACEFTAVAAFTHEIENFYDLVRKGKIIVTKEIIDLTLRARDRIKEMFDAYYCGGSIAPGMTEDILSQFKRLVPAGLSARSTAPAGTAKQRADSAASTATPGKQVTYRIQFRPGPDILAEGTDPLDLLHELCGLGTCKAVAQTDAIPFLEDFNPDRCYTSWDIILTTAQGINAIQDIFIFVKDSSDIRTTIIDEDGSAEDNEAAYKKLGEILLERGDIGPADLEQALRSKKKVGEVLVETGVVTNDKVEAALAEQEHVREMRERRQTSEAASSIRVSTDKLDGLVDLVGELVTVQARLSQTAATRNDPALLSIAEEVERLTADMRDRTMSIRMLPIGTTFSRFRRLVRDLGKELGKEVELATEGAETELDKTVIEKLGDPLVHLIRNSIDHGIESPEVRKAARKPKVGTISLSAVHSGAHVLIEIRDDGAGLDRDAVRAKAIERGLIREDAELTDKEVLGLVLLPGFSTAKTVTSVSGRGVGLDVVKRAIDALRGTIEIDSNKGTGTVITLRLPLTLAIIDGFLTKIGSENFIFPLSLVDECVELTAGVSATGNNKHMINVRGRIVPYVRLREQFSITGTEPAIEQIVIVRLEEKRVGFVVDHIVGGHQTVIKNLGTYYRDVKGLSGATILGDGTVALVLDVPKLVQIAETDEVTLTSAGGLMTFDN